jgi:anaerobic ribonucleoside-triphosphate reductase activating protein
MHYGELKKCDIANGIGVRVTLFVSGCTNHCPDCFQPQTWDFDYGKPFTGETKAEIFAELDKPFINGLTVLGGEPFEPRNQRELLPLLREVREKYPDKTIWCFTGFRLDDELLRDGSYPRCEATDGMLACINVLVDGRFVKELKDISLQFRGSRNQRVIDMDRTRETGQVTIWEKLRK